MKKEMKEILLITGVLLLLATAGKAESNLVMSDNFVFPNGSGEKRGCDPSGCGYFGAPRGSRTHKGLDFYILPGQKVKSPIDGYISRFPFPYANDLSYKGIEIIGSGVHDGFKVKIFYVDSTVSINTEVRKGFEIGIAQNISNKFESDMRNHIHLELSVNNIVVDPDSYF